MEDDKDPVIDTTQRNIHRPENTKKIIKCIVLFKYYSSVYVLMCSERASIEFIYRLEDRKYEGVLIGP
jgi:hypothetical protein